MVASQAMIYDCGLSDVLLRSNAGSEFLLRIVLK